MASKSALLSFRLEKLDNNLAYDPNYDFDFSSQDPSPGEGLQPMIEEAFKRIRRCLEKTACSLFHFGLNDIRNLNNHLHLATTLVSAAVQHADGTTGQTSILLVVKFYKLDPDNSYQVSIDLEELPSSSMRPDMQPNFEHGSIDNNKLERLALMLNETFKLDNKIELTPIIRRGRTSEPHYLRSTGDDERLLEYDFDRLLFHKRSEYQDVKIVRSSGLGNMLLLDNRQSFAQSDTSYLWALMDYGNVCYKNREILVLGGGDGGLLWEILKESPRCVTLVEIDPVVIEACCEHMRPVGQLFEHLNIKASGHNGDRSTESSRDKDRYKIIIDDCLKVLRQSVERGDKYDIILNDLTRRPVCRRQESLTAFDANAVQTNNEWHFIETIFNASMECLEPMEGVYMNYATSRSNNKSILAYEHFLTQSRYNLIYESRSAYVPSRMESGTFYSVRRRK